ncbi:MAG: hypothetical protein P1V35_00125 [Planctomycetota bacterium]|nr:hypothetical protein [Planctomycetota bacterium]
MNTPNLQSISTLGLLCAATLIVAPVQAQEAHVEAPVKATSSPVVSPAQVPDRPVVLDFKGGAVDGALAPKIGPRTPVVHTPLDTAPTDGQGGEPSIQRADFQQLLRERMHYDMQNGQVWAMGGDYKASAGPEGFSFMPFLGSDAPKTFEHKMRLSSATLGGEPIVLDGTAKVKRAGDRVILDRGPVDVFYDMSTESVEQSFELEVAGIDAELVIDIEVDSDGEMEIRGDAIYYVNDRGGISYSHAIVIDGAGKRLELPIVATKGNVRLTVPASFMAQSVAPVLVDPVINSYQVHAGYAYNLTSPDVAFDSTTNTFAYVHQSQWSTTDYDVWMETYGGNSGALVDLQSIDFSTGNVQTPNVANDAGSDQFLVASRRLEANGRWEVIGRMADATDISQRSPVFVIGDISGATGDPSGWDNLRLDVGGKSQGTSLFKVIWDREFFTATGSYVNLRTTTVTPVVPFSTVTPPSTSGLSAVTVDVGVRDTMAKISESSGMATVAEWRSAWIRTDIATGAQSAYTMLTADDNTQNLAPTLLFSLSSSFAFRDLDVTEGLTTMDGPLSASPVSLVACHFDGPNSADVWLYGVQDAGFFEEMHLTAREHQDLGQRPRFPAVAALASRFVIAYKEFNINTGQYTCYSSSVDLNNQNEFAVAERREVVAELGINYSADRPAAASRYSGGLYSSRYVGTAVSFFDGTFWTQEAAVMFPSQSFSPAHQYCAGSPNTTGDYGFISMGGTSATTGGKTLYASSMPLNQFGYFVVGHGGFGTLVPPGSAGTLCLIGGIVGRYNQGIEIQFTGTTGSFALSINPAAIRSNFGDVVGTSGQTYNFQGWHRENGGSSNFTNAVTLRFD